MDEAEKTKEPAPPWVEHIRLAHCTVDLSHRKVDWGNGNVFNLTGREVELLEYLRQHPRRIISRDELYRSVWGYHAISLSRAVDTAIKRLREKIELNPSEPQHIFTTYGMGYRFEPHAGLGPQVPPFETASQHPPDTAATSPMSTSSRLNREESGAPPVSPAPLPPPGPPDVLLTTPLSGPARPALTLAPTPTPAPTLAPAPERSSSHGASASPLTVVPMAREAEVAAILALFERGERLITLLGPPGIGKSTLASYAGQRLSREWPEPVAVWFCDLAEARTLDDIYSLLLKAIDGEGQLPDTLTALSQQLEQRLSIQGAALIVLDNVERLVTQVPQTLGRWLRRFPRLRWLVTSREQLPIEQGVPFVVEALPEPDAIQFFIKRARLQRWDFQPSPAVLSEIRQIVRHLDGIPLALELAAARIAVLSPAQILDRLRTRFDLLRRSKIGGNRRHDSMRQAIDGSWELLTAVEQRAFVQLAVFRGGFTLAAAEAVVDVSGFTDAPLVLDLLQLLVGRSLVHLESRGIPGPEDGLSAPSELSAAVPPTLAGDARTTAPPSPRFHLYECIREYVLEKLAGLDDREALKRRHASFYLTWAEGLVQRLRAKQPLPIAQLMAQEQPNLEEMFDYFKASDANALGRAALALQSLGLGHESRSVRFARFNDAVAFAEKMEVRLRIRLYFDWSSAYLVSSGWAPDAVESCQNVLRQALEQAEAFGTPELVAQSHYMLGRTYTIGANITEALPHLEAARTLCLQHKLTRLEMMVSLSIAPIHFKTGACDADAIFLELRSKTARQQDPLYESVVQAFVTETLEEQGNFSGAERMGRSMLEAAERHGLWEPVVLARLFLARALLDQQRYAEAEVVYREAAERVWRTDNPLVVASVYCEWSLLRCLQGAFPAAKETHAKGFQHIAHWSRPDIAQYFAILSFIQAATGELEEARLSILAAEQRLKGLENLSSQRLQSLCEVFLELHQAGGGSIEGPSSLSCAMRDKARMEVQAVASMPTLDPLLSPRSPLNVLRFVLRQLARLVVQALEGAPGMSPAIEGEVL